MGVIQNSVNQALGTAAAAATLGKHIQNQELERKAEIEGLKEKKGIAQENLKADIIEAASAIRAKALAGEEKGAEVLKFANDYKDVDFNSLDDKQIEDLGKTVNSLRAGEMTQSRIDRMSEKGEQLIEAKALPEYWRITDEDGKEWTKTDSVNEANKQLKEAYASYRELNSRIEATRALKFDRDEAEARIKAFKGGAKRWGGRL